MSVKVVKQKIKIFLKAGVGWRLQRALWWAAQISYQWRARVAPVAEVLLSEMQEPPLLRSCTLLGRPASNDRLMWCLGVNKTWASQLNSGELWSSPWGQPGCRWAAFQLNVSLCSSCLLPRLIPSTPWYTPCMLHSISESASPKGTNLYLRHLKY